MPEDYQAILNDLGVDTSNQSPTTNQPQTQDPTSQGTDGQSAQATVTDPNSQTQGDATTNAGTQDGGSQTTEDPDVKRTNDAFAALRVENGRYKKLLTQMMKGAGFTGREEDFISKIEDAAYRQQAQRQGNQVSPELLKRMDSLENQNKSLIDAQNRQNFIANMKGLQEKFNLTDNDVKDFVNLALKENIDLTIPGTNFITLYQGLFFDKLKDKLIEDERQKWIAQNNKANSATNPDGKSGKKDPTPTDVNTMAEFDSLLRSIPTEKK